MFKRKIFTGYDFFFIKDKDNFYAAGRNAQGQLQNGTSKTQFSLEKVIFPDQIEKVISNPTTFISFIITKNGKVYSSVFHSMCISFKQIKNDNLRQYIENTKKSPKVDDFFVHPMEFTFFKDKIVSNVFCGNLEGGSVIFEIKEKDSTLTYYSIRALSDDDKLTIKKIDLKDTIIDMKGGLGHDIILTRKGIVYGFGLNEDGQLGLGNEENQDKLQKIDFFIKKYIRITQISCGRDHSLFLTSQNDVYGCGFNSYSQLGIKDGTEYLSPVKLPITNIIKIECGKNHSFFVSKTGKIFACGNNKYHHLGINNNGKDVFVPTLISVWKNDQRFKFVDVYAGYNSTYFVNSFGEIYACGKNDHGQCCLEPSIFPQPIITPTPIKGKRINLERIFGNTIINQVILNKEKIQISDIIVKTKGE